MAKRNKEKDAAHEEVHKAGVAVARARVTLANANKRLEESVAKHVTTKPWSPSWFMHPGTLTIPEVQGAADLGDEQLVKLMARVQPRAKDARRKAAQAAKRKQSKPRTDRQDRAAAEDERPPGF